MPENDNVTEFAATSKNFLRRNVKTIAATTIVVAVAGLAVYKLKSSGSVGLTVTDVPDGFTVTAA